MKICPLQKVSIIQGFKHFSNAIYIEGVLNLGRGFTVRIGIVSFIEYPLFHKQWNLQVTQLCVGYPMLGRLPNVW